MANLFWLWVILGSVLSWAFPSLILWFKPYITISLGFIMLCMGLTLSTSSFLEVLKSPRVIGFGVLLQFVAMPFLGFLAAWLLSLSPELATGLILVCCCPGGTASNVIAYLANANVALSVLMTMCSTIAAVFLTPVLTSLYAGQYMEIDAVGLLLSTLKIVLIPVFLGILINTYFSSRIQFLKSALPMLSITLIVLIVGCIVALRRDELLVSGPILLLAALVVHSLGFVIGYILTLLVSKDKSYARTVSIEVGMQNSGLGAALATKHFPDPNTALPAAISAVSHCVLGSIAAALWGKTERR